MTAWLFRLQRLDTGRHAAWAVVCVEARYFSVAVPGASAFIRRMLKPADWKAIQAEIALGLNPGPLPASAALARTLAGGVSRDLIVQYALSVPLDAAPLDVAVVLDTLLRQQINQTT